MTVYTVKRATSSSADDFIMCSSRRKAIYAILGDADILAISWNNGENLIEKDAMSLNNWVNHIDELARGAIDCDDYPLVFIAQHRSYVINMNVI